MPSLRQLGSGLLDLVYPPACFACHAPLPGSGATFCLACEVGLLADSHLACPRCAHTVGPFAVINGRCALCRDESLPFDRAVRLGVYSGRLRDAVLQIKHHAAEGLAECLGTHLGQRTAQELGVGAVDVVTPVPLHWWRRLQRGYNQAAGVAFGVARSLRVPCRPWALRRIRATTWQSRLGPTERRDNVRGAFRARRPADLRGRRVLLVDDVATTGATLSEAAGAVLAAGAAEVSVAVLARAGRT